MRTEALLYTFSPFSNCYRAGRLNTEAAERHGVPRGPLLAQLKEGHDVVFPDGRAVQSAAVVSPPQRLGISSAPLADEHKHRVPK